MPGTSSDSVSKKIHSLWLEENPDLDENSLHGRKWIETLLNFREEDRQHELPEEIDNNLIILDECIAFFGCLQFAYLQEIENQQDFEDIYERRAFGLISGAIAHYLFCLRQLSVQGLDVGAKAISRIASEYIDTFSLLLKQDLAEDFCKSQDLDTANRFWHTYLSKGKLLKANRQNLRRFNLSTAEIDETDAWYKEENLLLSSTVHPTFMASYMASSSGSWGKGNTLGAYLGGFDTSQCRTLKFILVKILIFLASHRDFPFKIPKGRLLEGGIMHEYVRSGIIVIPRICALLLVDTSNPTFFREEGRFSDFDGDS